MKKLVCIAWVILLLCGCAGGKAPLNDALNFRERILNEAGCTFVATLQADYGSEQYEFVLSCSADQNGSISFEVLAPETISGIGGSLSSGAGNLVFDDVMIAFPSLSEDLYSPLCGPWILMSALRNGYLKYEADTEYGRVLTVLEDHEDDALQLNITFDSNNMPVYCDIFQDGRCVLSMIVEGFAFL